MGNPHKLKETLESCVERIMKGAGIDAKLFDWDINDAVLLKGEESEVIPRVGSTGRGVVVSFEVRADDGGRCYCAVLVRIRDNPMPTNDQLVALVRSFRLSVQSIWPKKDIEKRQVEPDDLGTAVPLEGPFPDGKPLKFIWTVPELLLRTLRALDKSMEFGSKISPSQVLSKEFGGKPNRYGQVVKHLRDERLLDIFFDTETNTMKSWRVSGKGREKIEELEDKIDGNSRE